MFSKFALGVLSGMEWGGGQLEVASVTSPGAPAGALQTLRAGCGGGRGT